MKEELVALVKELSADRSIRTFDEAATKQAIVLRLLSLLGWNTFNIDEVRPEYSVGEDKVDYSLRISGSDRVFLEAKRTGEDLDRHQEQLLNYSFKNGVKLAILTNGVTWWFYLPLLEGSWEQRRFYAVDLLEQESEEIASKFVDFLSKDSVASGKAIQNAEMIHNNRRKQAKIKEALPEAWRKIISESPDRLIDLIGDETEKLCGYKPDKETITGFLSENADQLLMTGETKRVESVGTSADHKQGEPSRLSTGERTPRDKFRIPILKSLVELGGRGETDKILEKVEAKMKQTLTPFDYDKLRSGVEIRWRNTAEWERYVMVTEGLLRKDSPRGIWEITDKGRKRLEPR